LRDTFRELGRLAMQTADESRPARVPERFA
jgi:hypothetical protein